MWTTRMICYCFQRSREAFFFGITDIYPGTVRKLSYSEKDSYATVETIWNHHQRVLEDSLTIKISYYFLCLSGVAFLQSSRKSSPRVMLKCVWVCKWNSEVSVETTMSQWYGFHRNWQNHFPFPSVSLETAHKHQLLCPVSTGVAFMLPRIVPLELH